MNCFNDVDKQLDYVELKGIFAEISNVADNVRLNAGYDQLYKVQDVIGYLNILLDHAETKIDSLLDKKEKELEDENY